MEVINLMHTQWWFNGSGQYQQKLNLKDALHGEGKFVSKITSMPLGDICVHWCSACNVAEDEFFLWIRKWQKTILGKITQIQDYTMQKWMFAKSYNQIAIWIEKFIHGSINTRSRLYLKCCGISLYGLRNVTAQYHNNMSSILFTSGH